MACLMVLGTDWSEALEPSSNTTSTLASGSLLNCMSTRGGSLRATGGMPDEQNHDWASRQGCMHGCVLQHQRSVRLLSNRVMYTKKCYESTFCMSHPITQYHTALSFTNYPPPHTHTHPFSSLVTIPTSVHSWLPLISSHPGHAG